MYGCEWDDETGDVNGYEQYGYDGEDFIVLDLKTMTWVAPQQQAVVTKQKWDNNKAQLEYLKNYFNNECLDWLKKYYLRVNPDKETLICLPVCPPDLPTVSLLQKTPSSRVTCHATGFYPNRILPNHDGSFQISADLQLPSDDWGKYDCVFQLSGVKEDIVTKLDKREIKTNYGKTSMRSDEREDLTVTVVVSNVSCKYSSRKSSSSGKSSTASSARIKAEADRAALLAHVEALKEMHALEQGWPTSQRLRATCFTVLLQRATSYTQAHINIALSLHLSSALCLTLLLHVLLYFSLKHTDLK
uniref:MHC class I-like antigen recognition-like domain-containing protein n=1 Tax=Labrus bergylta TaxID=56723 RepID=A0A3Q3EP76_9LABR